MITITDNGSYLESLIDPGDQICKESSIQSPAKTVSDMVCFLRAQLSHQTVVSKLQVLGQKATS